MRQTRQTRAARMTPTVLAAVVLLAGFLVLPALGQDEIKQLADPAFGATQRPAAVFAHDAHNEKAKIEDCAECHHVYENGRRVEGADSTDKKCSECHAPGVEKDGAPPLRVAYHENCWGCHDNKDTGPVTCGECHVKN